MYCINKTSRFNLKLIAMLFLMLGLHLFLFSATALADSNMKPIELDGWKYRWGDSSLDENGNYSWLNEDLTSSDWMDFKIQSQGYSRPKNQNYLWVGIKLQNINFDDPSIFFQNIAADSLQIYLDKKLIYEKNNSLLSNKTFITIYNKILLVADTSKKSQFLYLRIYSNKPYIGPLTSVKVGNYNELINYSFSLDIDKLILGFFISILGIFMIPIIFFLKNKDKYNFISLSIFHIFLGIWLLCQYLSSTMFLSIEPFLIHILFLYSILISMYALISFIQGWFSGIYNIIFNKLKSIFIALMLLYAGLIILNFFDLRYTTKLLSASLNILYLILAVIFIILIILIILLTKKGNIDAKFLTFGLSIFIIITIAELLLILFFNSVYPEPIISKWAILIFIISLIIIVGRRFFETNKKLVLYSNELEEKNKTLNNMWNELKNSKEKVDELNKNLEKKVDERTAQLKVTQKQLIQSEKMAALGGLVTGIAHEINTPVGIGVTASSHLEKETIEILKLYSNNKMRKNDFEIFLNTCKESSSILLSNLKRASELIKAFKGIAVDRSTEEKKSFKLKENINNTLISLSPKFREVECEVNINCSADFEFRSFPGVFSQIFTNLILNSLTHGFSKNEKGLINIDIYQNNNNLIIKYSDDGNGIEKENIEKIFDPFFTTNRGQGGTGLGLNIIYNLVSQTLNGTIKCESTLGQGTTFVMKFPLPN